MNPERVAGPLILDSAARIVAGEGVVHLVHRGGAFDLRGKNLERLHDRLAPLLDGRFTREEVLASAGRQATIVGRYLEQLSELGVVREGPPPAHLPEGFPEPCLGIQERMVGGVRIAVTLAGPSEAARGIVRLSCVSRAAMDRMLLNVSYARPDGREIWIRCGRDDSCEDTVEPAELQRRATVARYVLAVELGRKAGKRLSIYELAHRGLSLRRLAEGNPPSKPLSTLASQLDLVRPSEQAQLPLTVMLAELPGMDRRRLAYGVENARDLRDALTAAFLGREALLLAAADGAVVGRLGRIGEPDTSGDSVRITPEDAALALVANTRLDRDRQLVCEQALGLANGGGRDIDLLAVRPPSIRAEVLQDFLRSRRSSFVGTLDERLAPLLIFRSSSFSMARIGFEETIVGALLLAVAAELGLNRADALGCAPPLCHAETMRRRIRRVLVRLPGPLRAIRGSVRALGSTFFFGIAV